VWVPRGSFLLYSKGWVGGVGVYVQEDALQEWILQGVCSVSQSTQSLAQPDTTQHHKTHDTSSLFCHAQEMVSVAQRVAPHVSRALESYLEGALEMEE
jgi:hypothetical protein